MTSSLYRSCMLIGVSALTAGLLVHAMSSDHGDEDRVPVVREPAVSVAASATSSPEAHDAGAGTSQLSGHQCSHGCVHHRSVAPVTEARDDHGLSAAERASLSAFDAWLQEHLQPGHVLSDQEQAQGLALAQARVPGMRKLIMTDPEAAWEHAVSTVVWQRLPQAIQPLVERRIQEQGIFSSNITCETREHVRCLTFADRSTGEVYVADSLKQTTGALQGEVTGLALEELTAMVALGDAVNLEVQALGDQPGVPQPASNWDDPPTVGTLRVLAMIIRFSDETDYSSTISQTTGIMNSVAAAFDDYSYGQLTMVFDVIELEIPGTRDATSDFDMVDESEVVALAMGYNVDDYDVITRRNSKYGNYAYIGSKMAWLRKNSWTTYMHEIGHCLGLYHANYWKPDPGEPCWSENGTNQLYAEDFSMMSNSPRGDFNAPEKLQLNWLAGADIAEDVPAGVYRIYPYDSHAGNFDDTGVAGAHYAVSVYKDAAADNGAVRAREYVLSIRNQPEKSGDNNNPWFSEGVLLHWKQWTNDGSGGYGNNGAFGPSLVDIHVGSDADGELGSWRGTNDAKEQYDAPVLIGETYLDDDPDNRDGNIYITPLVKVDPDGTPRSGDEYVDVKIVKGDQSKNDAPTANWTISDTVVAPGEVVSFSVSASDPDDTVFGYLWDFGIGTTGLDRRKMPLDGLPTQSFSWDTQGVYQVTVVVSDCRGKTATLMQNIIVSSMPDVARSVSVAVTGSGPLSTNMRGSQDNVQLYEASAEVHLIDGVLGSAVQDDGLNPVFDTLVEFIATVDG